MVTKDGSDLYDIRLLKNSELQSTGSNIAYSVTLSLDQKRAICVA